MGTTNNPRRRHNMKRLMAKIGNFLREDDGVTAIEYGLIAALIAIVIIVVVALAGGRLNNKFSQVASALA